MALEFNPNIYLELERMRREDQERRRQGQLQGFQGASNNILQGLQMLAQNSQQKQLMDLQRQKMEEDRASRLYEQGDPGVFNDQTVGMPTGQVGKSSIFPGGQGQVGTSMPMLDQFKAWQAGGMKGPMQEGYPQALGSKGRKEYMDTQEFGLKERANVADINYKNAQAEKARAEAMNPQPSIPLNLQWQMQKDQEKQERELQELQVPGYEMGSGVRPTQKEAQDIRTGVAAVDDFKKGADRLIELIKKYGSTNMIGEGSGEMQSLASDLKLTLKEVKKLGVLSSTDTAFLESLVFDPTGFKSLLSGSKQAIKQLETTRDKAASFLSENLKSRGYSSTGYIATARDAQGNRMGTKDGVNWEQIP